MEKESSLRLQKKRREMLKKRHGLTEHLHAEWLI
jgi:hypothetical protein